MPESTIKEFEKNILEKDEFSKDDIWKLNGMMKS